MQNSELMEIRKSNGIYYTPDELADFLIMPVLNRSNLSIFDPSFGNGALLSAAERACVQSGHKSNIFGCDKSPCDNVLFDHSNWILAKCDYFKYQPQIEFDAILMNPPFVRHHLIDNQDRIEYQSVINPYLRLIGRADLWAYFLVRAVTQLNPGGCIAAILPWSFIQAEFSVAIRKWLYPKFKNIRILTLSQRHFEKCKERIILMWLFDYGNGPATVNIAHSPTITSDINYVSIPQSLWTSPIVSFLSGDDIEDILNQYKLTLGWHKLEEHAKINIGVVTGADEYFILPENEFKQRRLNLKLGIPILSSSKELKGLDFNGYWPSKRLLCLPKDPTMPQYYDYIAEGLENNYHIRAHSKLREPWYSIKKPDFPDAFFPYRSAHTPYMVYNNSRFLGTNSIHSIFLNNMSLNERKWLQVAILSAPSQLSIEAYSKTYGDGVLKIEPHSLKSTLIYIPKEKCLKNDYNHISTLLRNRDKIKAIEYATVLLSEKSGITKVLADRTINALYELRDRRFGRQKNGQIGQ